MNHKWIALPATLTLAACSSEPKPPPRAAVAPIAQEAPAAPPPAPVPPQATPALRVSEDIRSACALPEPQTHFAYNSSRVQNQDQQFLAQLSTCFTRGPLAQRRIHLVGHADPRGSEPYNLALGRERADSVKVAMLMLGLSREQVSTESRGERDATGSDEAGWARDRRVEASLRE